MGWSATRANDFRIESRHVDAATIDTIESELPSIFDVLWMNRKSKLNVQQTAKSALARVLSKLTEIALESGIGVSEIESLLRHGAVALVAERQMSEIGRVNVSGISAATGLSRSAVSHALRLPRRRIPVSQVHTQFTNRVLGSWYRDPKFTGQDGLPAVLPIYGKGITFESLTRKYGGGVPVRALLDELSRVSAVELLPDQKVRPRSMIAVNRGVNLELIESIGLRAEDLLQTFLENLRQVAHPKFVATVQSAAIPDIRVSFVRREIEKRSTAFLSEIEETVLPTSAQSHVASRSAAKSRQIGVTVYYHDQEPKRTIRPRNPQPRKNLKRSHTRPR